ncbi:acyl-CoA dehydrogenase family protein, partial [Limimaricola sp.]|uniref:acyl-CoA dehydrogenase family protein n=1 Tax=Limimaricola sp. TaxID=2211665 RepID=UPI004058409C
MPSYTAPIRDMQFVLHEMLDISGQDIPGYADLDADFTAAILEEAGKLSSGVLAPLNLSGDQEGCHLENGVVRTPKGFKAAFDQIREGGWTAIDVAEEFGGQGLPYLMHTAANEPMVSANMALNMYQGLTHGAYTAINIHGTDEQKSRWLPKLGSCEWTGTMNLTEPQAGSDLSLVRTRAEPQGDGTYKLFGTKIF